MYNDVLPIRFLVSDVPNKLKSILCYYTRQQYTIIQLYKRGTKSYINIAFLKNLTLDTLRLFQDTWLLLD